MVQDLPNPERTKLPYPDPIQVETITWTIITITGGRIVIGLTPEQFDRLTRNDAEVARWVNEARTQLEYSRGERDAGTE